MIRVVHPGSGSGSRILILYHPGSRVQESKKHWIPDPNPQHWYGTYRAAKKTDSLASPMSSFLIGNGSKMCFLFGENVNLFVPDTSI
jgi:hypothetical protein